MIQSKAEYQFTISGEKYKLDDKIILKSNIIQNELKKLEKFRISTIGKVLALVQNQKDLYGYINKEGKEVIPCKYKYAGDFHEDLANADNQILKKYSNEEISKLSFKLEQLAQILQDQNYIYDIPTESIIPITDIEDFKIV